MRPSASNWKWVPEMPVVGDDLLAAGVARAGGDIVEDGGVAAVGGEHAGGVAGVFGVDVLLDDGAHLFLGGHGGVIAEGLGGVKRTSPPAPSPTVGEGEDDGFRAVDGIQLP